MRVGIPKERAAEVEPSRAAVDSSGVAVVRRRLRVTGVVQGVGFRPFVARLARRFGLSGFVANDPGGVLIEVEGPSSGVDRFALLLESEAPPAALLRVVLAEDVPAAGERAARFVIRPSRGGNGDRDAGGGRKAEAPPDLATCDACRAEVHDPRDRRHRYPFTNCTNCGPRYTIIRNLPYDRVRTSMASFPLCAACAAEYRDPADRRYHAEPIACPDCGPRLALCDVSGERIDGDPIAAAAAALAGGGIVAMKGLGGFQLAADASSPAVVAELRRRKGREAKPFALMVRDLAAARRVAALSPVEERLLASAERPILLVRRRAGTEVAAEVAAEVAPGQPRLGIMLPTTPLHDLLLEVFAERRGRAALVMTSGNRTGEPIAIDGEEARAALRGIADLFLDHDRPILLSADDPVVRVDGGSRVVLRHGRGQAPAPVSLAVNGGGDGGDSGGDEPPCVLACGGDLKSAVCLTRGRDAFLSPYLGDLEGLAAEERLGSTAAGLERLLGVKAEVVAVDLHPDERATRFGRARGLPVIEVQHHHAHIASCLAENGEAGPVIGLALDGFGLGPDGTIWGGEMLIADRRDYSRAGHLSPVPQPGGDRAAREPWRMAVSHLHAVYGEDARDGSFRRLGLPFLGALDGARLEAVVALARTPGASPVTTSAGRLFDAVAAITGICFENRFEGEAAMALEAAMGEDAEGDAGGGDEEAYLAGDDVVARGAALELRTAPLIRGVVLDVLRGVEPARVSRRFHHSLAALLAAGCAAVRAGHGLDTVALGGGVFQNACLARETARRLERLGFRVLRHRRVPASDNGLALGQAAVAAARLLAARR